MFKKILNWLWNEIYEVCVLIGVVLIGTIFSVIFDSYVVDKLHWHSTDTGFAFLSGMVYIRWLIKRDNYVIKKSNIVKIEEIKNI